MPLTWGWPARVWPGGKVDSYASGLSAVVTGLAAAADDILHISGTVQPVGPAVIEGAQRADGRTQALVGVASGGGSA